MFSIQQGWWLKSLWLLAKVVQSDQTWESWQFRVTSLWLLEGNATKIMPNEMLNHGGGSAKRLSTSMPITPMIWWLAIQWLVSLLRLMWWLCTLSPSVESSMYGSKLVAAWIAVDLMIELCFWQQALGVTIDGPTLMLSNNKSMVLNTSNPSSMLKKKHYVINSHQVWEAFTSKAVLFNHIPSTENESDVLMKLVSKDIFYYLIMDFTLQSGLGEQETEGCNQFWPSDTNWYQGSG